MLTLGRLPVVRSALPTGRVCGAPSSSALICMLDKSRQVAHSANPTVADLKPEQAKSVAAMPGPPCHPVIGNLMFLMQNGGVDAFSDSLQVAAKQYGKIFKLDVLMMPKMYCVSDPEIIKDVFRKEGKIPRREYPHPAWSEYHKKRELQEGVFLSEGQQWYKDRMALNVNLLKPKTVESYIPEFNSVSDDLLANLSAMRDINNEVVGLESQLFKWSLESVATVVFDKRIGCFDTSSVGQKSAKFISATQDIFSNILTSAVEIPLISRFYKTKAYRNVLANLDILYEFIEGEIKMSLENSKDSKGEASELGFIPFLVYDRKMERKDLMTNIMSLMAAAVETTSSSLLWALLCVAQNPEAQIVLHGEVVSVLQGDEKPTAEHLRQMPYVRAVVKESMRLYPVVPMNSRRFEEDTVIAGYRIPADDFVILCHDVISHNAEYFPEPMKFMPERWLRENESSKLIHPYSSLPFGFGSRMCLGRRLAEQEMYIALTRLVRKYTIEYNHGEVKRIFKGVSKPSAPLVFKFTER